MQNRLTTREIANTMSISVATVNNWTIEGLSYQLKNCELRGRPYKVIKFKDLKRFILESKPKYKVFLDFFKK